MPILRENELLDYYLKYRNVIAYIADLNSNSPDNQQIKQIQIPSSLTQSIAYYFILENPLVIGLTQIDSNLLKEGSNRTYDLIYNSTSNIEVKATGSNTFQRFRKTALSANFAIWINFNVGNNFDIAVFIPQIINPNDRKEVEIDWRNLNKYGKVNYFRDKALK